MDYLSGFASSIARDLVCGAANQLRYPCCFNNFVEELAKEEGNLIAARDSVQNRVTRAKKQTRKTAEVGDKWLKDADNDASNVNQLLKEARTKKSSCFGYCPNWIWRYRLGKKLANRKRELDKCIEESRQYIEFEHIATLPSGTHDFLSKKCLNFESRQPAYEQLMEALRDDDVAVIGLYGMGGCGKTTLAMEVRKKAEAEHLFDQVLFVPVSSVVEVRRIQEKIASSMQYTFPENEEMERAQRLYMRLTQENKLLVILDGLWEKLDFGAIGIPSNEHHKGCKVLITTRSEEVCTMMDCQKKIHLPILTDEEAWTLFQKQAHISEGTSDTLKHLAREISDECKGLPVAIAAVASSLKGKSEVVWRVALNRFTSSKQVVIGKGLQNPYTCLQLSYDNLDTEEAKSLFLLCSVFPEDSEIPIELLTRLAIGLGVVGEVHSYQEARNEVIAAKIKLVSSCLLLGVDHKSVKMHDLVRYVAHRIANNENKIIECALEKDVTMEHSSVRFLCCDKIPNELDCSNLEFLYLNTNLDVSDGIFKGMRMLRVLFLYNKGRYRRPLLAVTFKSLPNLRCVLLRNWELGDISFLGDAKKLESLALHNCSFLELPDIVVTQLTNLRLLDLSECDMKRSPFEVIGRQPQLEELYFADHRSKRDFYNEHAAEFFQNFRVPQALQRYHIQLGNMFAGFQEEFPNRHRTLFLSYLDTSNAAVKDLAEKAEVLCLANIEGGAQNILPDIFQKEGGMSHLIELLISDSDKIVCLVDTSHHLSEVGALFSNLHWLRVERMKHLGALHHGSLLPSGYFEKLEELYLSHCPKLTCLFTLDVAQNLERLEKLEIISCPGLKHIVTDDDKEEISTDDKRLLFPKLKRLHVRECNGLDYLLPISFAQGLAQLESLEIVCNSELKYLFGQCTNGDHLAGQKQNELKIDLTSLEELTLIMLPEIISICPEVCYPTWPSLRRFSLQNCPGFSIVSINTCLAYQNNDIINEASHLTLQNIKEVRVNNCELEGIIQLAELSIDAKQGPLTSCLEMLYLENLPQLRYICKGDIQSSNLLQNLQQMEVSGCRKLKSIFSACISGGLPQLKELKIEKCNQLQQIIEDKEHQNTGSFDLPSLTRLTLKSCPLLGSLFTTSAAETFTSLEELMIEDCHGLKHILIYGRAHTNKKEEMIQDDHDIQSYLPFFPSLKKLSIMRCHLLQYVFPISFARGLRKLETIEISETSELRHVFGQNIHSSHQYQNKIQIEFPVLEKVALHSTPNMIGIFPENYCATCSSLQLLVMNDVGMSTLSINNVKVDLEATHSDHSSKTDSRAMSRTIKQKLVSVIIENNSKIKEIFHLEGFPIDGQQVTSWSEVLQLVNLPELMYIWTSSKHFVNLQVQRLRELHICNCPKLKAIFSASILRMLPLLKILVVEHCEELEQIIEDDKDNENGSNSQYLKVCFSQLKFLLVSHCNNLKHLFFISISHEFPELEHLILNQNSQLVQVFGDEAGVREGRVEVLLPKLKHVVLMQQPNLINFYQEIEFQTVINLLVHNCPKFLLTSTTTVKDMLQISSSDKEIDFYLRPHLLNISGNITKGHEVLTTKKENKGTQDLQSWDQKLPLIPLPNLIDSIENTVEDNTQEEAPSEEVMKETLSGGVEGASMDGVVAAYTKSDGADTVPDSLTNFELIQRPSPSYLDVLLYKTHSNGLVDGQLMSEPCLMYQQKPLGEIASNVKIPQRVAEEGTISNDANMATLSLSSKSTSSQSGQLVTSQCKSYPHSEIRHNQTEPYTAKEREGHPINIIDFVANDLTSLFQPVEEDGEGQVTACSIFVVAGNEDHHSTEDNRVIKAIADLEKCQKMALKDIASSESNSLLLLTALNFLSNLPLKDVTLSDGLKDAIDTMHKEFPSILCSFQKAFATTHKLAVLEAHQNKVAITLASKISEAKNFMDEAQQKEVVLKERVIRLRKEMEDCEADLSSLQEEKKKCIAETKGYKEDFENVRKDKSQMVEDQRK
ncbi:Disease resistance protein, partial [Mucuna pruriens]